MHISPLQIATGRVGQTLVACDHVQLTVFDVGLNRACLGVIAPAGMAVSSSPPRKLMEAAHGVKMASWNVGESFSIGPEIIVFVLTAKEEKVRLGISTALARATIKVVRRRGTRANKPDAGRGRRRRGNHIHGVL